MLHPSYTELMTYINRDEEVIKSRYSIVMGTAKRARQLVDYGYEPEDPSVKPLSVAVEELNSGRIHFLTEEEEAAMEAERAAKAQAAETAEEAEAEEENAEEPAEAEETEETADTATEA